MANYLITYDLIKDKDYSRLIAAIKSISNGRTKPLESVWIIGHDGSAVDIVKALNPYIDSDDRLLVTKITDDTAWTKTIREKSREWLKQYI